ncbi:N-acetylmuramoyl-L-alanine amidase [Danxiaibacter flavus]|uniref:N-acetylmuramoyl-L-alanine amidase n=1 Tax=Danxiaibacter flavus TaxID=3049108 RepID=A0ABV3ZJX4_9BACT|nr:N-acetylmuramoyl-L-alanine amidase [Chitinophagaceae bacterium DXS]
MKKVLFVASMLVCTMVHAQHAVTSYSVGKTTGDLPYMEYGLGDDRLGGAKMTYLDTNVLVRVVDSVKDDYEVQLSRSRFAYLPKSSVVFDSVRHIKPYYLTGSCKVYGDSLYDYVNVLLDEKLPYTSIQQINPSRIVVDIFGATSNTNWITQLSTAKEIKNTWYEQVDNDVFRLIIELKHPQHWGHTIYYDRNKLVIRVKQQPANERWGKLKIAIDAGHGGANRGAEGVTSKILEKDYTLLFAQQLEQVLKKKGFDVFMTRNNDTTLDMIERVYMLREYQPDVLLSLHLNSAGNDTVKGTSTYYRYIGFRPLTQSVMKRMLQTGLSEFGNVGNFNFALSGPTDYPNCLTEIAFLSNVDDEKKVLDAGFRKKVANQIYLGLNDWLATNGIIVPKPSPQKAKKTKNKTS